MSLYITFLGEDLQKNNVKLIAWGLRKVDMLAGR
jgi:hypothetical protein